MTLTVQREKFTKSFKGEMWPLLQVHYTEISANLDIPLDPDFSHYEALQDQGHLVLMTARLDGELIGYLAYALGYNPHYQDSLQAHQDVYFVKRDKRKSVLGAGYMLLKRSHEVLKEMGVQVVTQHVKVKHDFSPFLEKLGYDHIEHIYQKRLD